eukprot:gnl/TRDRNA2_/TRDRNA2_194660_c0_seq1.p2 gnl/TRDRNA2_/TRDRNA2_194660_c0~~gnl/TRDRNA2_/TRDRNA2_194660_c0_seq1.p2  ORF type:complete len:186 (-),score=45.63 gnl/TRDRNA2_/TRDRNA2_194660_c0_seq1:28-528(-)
MPGAEQLQQAKVVIRDFVQEMRSGRRMMVLTPKGQLKATTCSLNKRLTVFRIVQSGKIKRIPLTDIIGIHAGAEPEGLTTPLDEMSATMAVGPDGALISFRFEHINARDTFVMCMMLFAQSVMNEQQDEEDDEEDVEEAGAVPQPQPVTPPAMPGGDSGIGSISIG